MTGVLFAIITVLVWGLWLTPSQTIPFKNQQIKTFYVAAANFMLAFFIGLQQGFRGLTLINFIFPFAGGLIWAVSGYYAFLATNRLGIARAIGIWAPLNILVSIGWGIVLFGEFLKLNLTGFLLVLVSLGLIIAGIIIIIFSQDASPSQDASVPDAMKTGRSVTSQKTYLLRTGIAGAIMAGILWGSYFVPIRVSALSMWVAAFPLATGILTGSLVLVLFSRQTVILEKPSYYFRVGITGLLWGIGNLTSLKMMEEIGTGRGFTIAQLSVALNALASIFIFKQPHPRSKAAVFTIIGIGIALAGGILLGNLK